MCEQPPAAFGGSPPLQGGECNVPPLAKGDGREAAGGAHTRPLCPLCGSSSKLNIDTAFDKPWILSKLGALGSERLFEEVPGV